MSNVYVSTTGFRPKAGVQFVRFWWHTLRSLAQARRSPGIIEVSARKIGGTYHTMTVWTDEASMVAFVRSGAHRRAMRNFREFGSGKTHGFVADGSPGWNSAYGLWLSHAKEA
jgi:heme-degrading monooxygenase HmoA